MALFEILSQILELNLTEVDTSRGQAPSSSP